MTIIKLSKFFNVIDVMITFAIGLAKENIDLEVINVK